MTIRHHTAATAALCLAIPVLAYAGPKEIAEPITVETDPANPLDVQGTVGLHGPVEVTPSGGSLDVEVTDPVEIKNTVGDPIDVIERPGNANYVWNHDLSPRDGDPAQSRVFSVPFPSHMKGMNVSAYTAGSVGACLVQLFYPGDPALRPPNGSGGSGIASAVIPAPGGTVFVPLSDLFASDEVNLTLTGNALFAVSGGQCFVDVQLQFSPIPEGFEPPIGF